MSLAIFSIPNLQPPTKPQSLRLPSIFVSLKHGNVRAIENCLSYLDPRRLTPTGVHCRKKTSRNNRHFTITTNIVSTKLYKYNMRIKILTEKIKKWTFVNVFSSISVQEIINCHSYQIFVQVRLHWSRRIFLPVKLSRRFLSQLITIPGGEFPKIKFPEIIRFSPKSC